MIFLHDGIVVATLNMYLKITMPLLEWSLGRKTRFFGGGSRVLRINGDHGRG